MRVGGASTSTQEGEKDEHISVDRDADLSVDEMLVGVEEVIEDEEEEEEEEGMEFGELSQHSSTSREDNFTEELEKIMANESQQHPMSNGATFTMQSPMMEGRQDGNADEERRDDHLFQPLHAMGALESEERSLDMMTDQNSNS